MRRGSGQPGRSRQRRVEILRSAAAAFRRRGYHGASVGEIARDLRMTKGSLYYYFKNKEEILYFCHDYSLDILLDLLARVERETRSPDERLRQLIVSFVHMIIDELQGTALTMDLQALSPRLLRKVIAKRDLFDRGVRRVLKEGMDRGLFVSGDPKLLTFAILGAVNWITRWFDPRGPARSEEIAQAFADYLLAGLLRPAAARGRSPRRALA
ncbi:MAG TPA: TetR/AcrR family transcriptional regulator [Vicinamibacteria bacterium]|jgi:AcrR family transcriptional regulator|nr:TetR/AcrR family transcriptional regulator [Vicinamibacteria bacterium]